jgi:hypothetical protein
LETIGYTLFIIVGCLIPVAWGLIMVADAKTGRGPAPMEAMELFCVLIVYAVFIWTVAFTIASVIHAYLT